MTIAKQKDGNIRVDTLCEEAIHMEKTYAPKRHKSRSKQLHDISHLGVNNPTATISVDSKNSETTQTDITLAKHHISLEGPHIRMTQL